jgi:glycosyltransferase involved in cell wall biosynthesis
VWLRVLYVDYSVGFGGATKSLSLVCGVLPGVEKFVVTCQEPHLIRTWYGGMRVFRFRQFANYRTYARASARLSRFLGNGLIFTAGRKLVAAFDLTVSLRNTVRLAALIRRHRIDCVHLNNGLMPLEGLLAARVAGVPCIVHARGMAGEKRGLTLRASRWVTHTIAVSQAVAGTVRTFLGGQDVTTVYDPVDLAQFDATEGERTEVRRRLGFGTGDVVVGMFGRIVRWKGQLEFVRAMAVAMQQNPALRAVIVGDESDGGAEYFAEVRRAIAASGHAERFVLTGYQPVVSGFYHASDIVVHASVEPEPFGMVVPEAMAARRPIIASAAGGPCEVIADGVDGLLVPPGDVPALARAIVALGSDPARRRAMGERGRAKVVEAFGVDHIARQVAAVYRAVLGRGPAPPDGTDARASGPSEPSRVE